MIDKITIFFEGLLFLFLFHVVGHPVVNVFLRRVNIPDKLKNLDFIQKLPLEFVTGGAIIYMVTLVTTPFNGFNAISSWIVTGIAAFAYAYQHLKGLASFNKPSTYSWMAMGCFIIVLAIRVGPISNFVLGSNQDTSWHTLLTYSIIRNGGVPFSVVENFILQVPVGVHTNLAYFSLLTGTPAEFVAFHSLVFFGTIIGLAAYLFGSVFHSEKFGLYLSIVMITIMYYPSAITWGAPWLALGLLIFFVITSLLVSISIENLSLNRSGILTALLPSVVSGFLASTFIPLYVILILFSFLFALLSRKAIFAKLKGLTMVFSLGVPLFVVWIYRFFFLTQPTNGFIAGQAATMTYNQAFLRSAYFLPFKWFGSPNVILNTVGNWLTWDYQNGWPGWIFSFGLLILGGILLISFLVNHRVKALDSLLPRYVVAIVFVLILWGLNGPLGAFYITSFGLGIMMSELDKVIAIMGTILLPIIVAYAITSIDSLISNGKKGKLISAGVVVLVISASMAIAPLAQAWQVGSYKIFASSTESDYELLKWMRSEIPSNSNVLVNTEDAGQYVPSIGGQHAVYFGSTGVKAITLEYHNLYNQIKDKTFNLTTIELFRNLTVDYVFLGASAFEVGGWDPVYFLRNPWYFRLVHSVGRSGLFEVNIPNRNISNGYISSRDYLGFSSSETSLDLKNMMLVDLEKNESVFVEIGLTDVGGKGLQVMNYWHPPVIASSAINLTGTSTFTLIGANYTFNLVASLTRQNGIDVNISAENAPAQSSIYFSYFPVYDVRQGNSQFTTDQTPRSLLSSNILIQGTKRDSGTTFEMIPEPPQIVTTYLYYISARSTGALDIVLHSQTLDEIR